MTGFLTGPATTTDLLRLKPRETPLRGRLRSGRHRLLRGAAGDTDDDARSVSRSRATISSARWSGLS
ncbi:hypothetical protein HMPREF1318_2300 [Actinomyces massiliensis F0489]|uniref:Uncharacterized protein n=1 Tax=Actinomyces massiliensis F0489 TaxID=1125718 RepID=J0NIU8_9ACTO|nr:hypothetical protein HMPREF1318_2300 [Actinomyces massiliensis F0489]